MEVGMNEIVGSSMRAKGYLTGFFAGLAYWSKVDGCPTWVTALFIATSIVEFTLCIGEGLSWIAVTIRDKK
jgi:hypothetical protein